MHIALVSILGKYGYSFLVLNNYAIDQKLFNNGIVYFFSTNTLFFNAYKAYLLFIDHAFIYFLIKK